MQRISLIGSGNVASNLGLELQNKGYEIKDVWSRTQDSAQVLAEKLNANWTTKINELENVDLFIVTVKDDAIKNIISKIKNKDIPIVHTSGSVGIDILKGHSLHGVFYPIQSFNKNVLTSFRDVPICIESNNKKMEKSLYNIANTISSSVHLINSDQRSKIHLSAVFACNFTNHMIAISETLLEENNIEFELLHPLISHTLQKSIKYSARKSQTGPAIRNDQKTIQKHLQMIKQKPELSNIYSTITNHIILSLSKNK